MDGHGTKLLPLLALLTPFGSLALLLLAAGATVLALANSSDDLRPRFVPPEYTPTLNRLPELNFDVREFDAWQPNRGLWGNLSYGWPLLCRQHVVGFTPGPILVAGRCRSAGRLAANTALSLEELLAWVTAENIRGETERGPAFWNSVW